MNQYTDLQKRMQILEYHHRLLIKIVTTANLDFFKLVVEYGISEQEVQAFFYLCETLNKKMKEQKAEGYMNFHPLFLEFSKNIPKQLNVREAIKSCLAQQLFVPFFKELEVFL